MRGHRALGEPHGTSPHVPTHSLPVHRLTQGPPPQPCSLLFITGQNLQQPPFFTGDSEGPRIFSHRGYRSPVLPPARCCLCPDQLSLDLKHARRYLVPWLPCLTDCLPGPVNQSVMSRDWEKDWEKYRRNISSLQSAAALGPDGHSLWSPNHQYLP